MAQTPVMLCSSTVTVCLADAKVQAPPEIDDRHYSQTIKGLMVVVGSASLVLFWMTVYWSAKAGLWLLSLFGSYGCYATAVLVVYLVVSFARAFRAVQPLPHMPAVRDKGVNGIEPVHASKAGPDATAGGSTGNSGSGHASFAS